MNTAMRPYMRYTLWLILAVTLFRLGALYVSPLQLHGDEAQYWAWSQNLDWGYFTKPPLIAWVIALTTTIFGNAEWAVRLASPLLHSGTAWIIFATTRVLYDDRTGFWAACLYLLMPAVWLSSGIITTDMPLLLFWALALNAWVHLRKTHTWLRALQLGIALGLGIMAKYAMLFIIPALCLCLIYDKPTRQALINTKGVVALGLVILIITPNIIWNFQHDFATFSHTAANANLDSKTALHPVNLLAFWRDQMVVYGPVTFALFLLSIIAIWRKQLETPALYLGFFALMPLVIISVEALLSRANANWAVTAYIAASIITAHYAVTFWPRLRRWFAGNIIVQTSLCLVLGIALLIPNWTDTLKLTNSVKRLRGWPETVTTLEDLYMQGHKDLPYQALAVDRRILFYDLKYYGIEKTAPLRILRFMPHLQNHAELTAPLNTTAELVLIIGVHDQTEAYLGKSFARIEALPDINIPLGGRKMRRLQVWAGYDYQPPER